MLKISFINSGRNFYVSLNSSKENNEYLHRWLLQHINEAKTWDTISKSCKLEIKVNDLFKFTKGNYVVIDCDKFSGDYFLLESLDDEGLIIINSYGRIIKDNISDYWIKEIREILY